MPKQRTKKGMYYGERRRVGPILIAIGIGALGALIAAVAIVAAQGGGNDGPRSRSSMAAPVEIAGPQAAVKVVDNDFDARDIIINRGAAVTWRNEGDLPHDVTAEDGAFASTTMERGAGFMHRFDAAGTYYYYCTIHHTMRGSVTVR
jgi:plastocyanin